MRRVLLFLGLLVMAAPASAWWEYGHQTVAQIALAEVRPETRAEIRRLLSHSDLLATPTCPAGTLEQASVWADCVRPLGDRFSYSFPWHYQNVHVCRPFDQEAACRDGNCISAQIERQARLLADESVPLGERVMALVFLTHFLGDLHMPLHAGDRGDLGGNRVPVNYGIIGGRTNLHSAWDGYIAERGISEPPPHADGILSALGIEEKAAMRGGTVEDWARESWQLSRDVAYASLFGDPCAAVPEGTRPTITEDMVRGFVPIIRTQIARGGLRLAQLLDQALTGELPPSIAERR